MIHKDACIPDDCQCISGERVAGQLYLDKGQPKPDMGKHRSSENSSKLRY
jgi:hypothetical protein